ncbi:MAG: cytochrome c biogenesis protein CcmE, partial [Gammaproteobacteria bacterium]
FREGQGIIANGKLDDKGDFIAQEVLAKHDENYMPPELAGMHKSEDAQAEDPY